jgi:hypothetical protein
MVVLATSSAQNADVSRFVNLPLALQFSSEEGKMNLRNVVVNGWRMTSMTDWLDWLTDSLFMLCIPEETINWLFMLSIPEESYWSSFDSHHQPVTIERFSVRSAPPILSYPILSCLLQYPIRKEQYILGGTKRRKYSGRPSFAYCLFLFLW